MGRYSEKDTVEGCLSISITWLKNNNYLDGFNRHGGMSWKNAFGENIGNIGFEVSMVGGSEYIRLNYSKKKIVHDDHAYLDYKITLTSTACHFGGHRWWFICPLSVRENYCGRRVGRLYLGGGSYFGCRHCYNLTYQSCKDSHKLDSMFMKMGIDPIIGKQIFKKEC